MIRGEKLTDSFANRWEKTQEPSFSRKVKEAVRPPGPLKPRLDNAVRRIEVQVQKMDQASTRFNDRDKSIFNQVVDAYSKHDAKRAGVYASELAEIRKMEKTTMHAKLALDHILLRLKTVTELGDIAATLLPAIGVIHEVKNGMSSVSPQISREMGEIGNLLNGIVLDAGTVTGMSVNFESANEDAQKIMEEAAMVAEQRMKDTFPELPGKSSLGTPVTDRT